MKSKGTHKNLNRKSDRKKILRDFGVDIKGRFVPFYVTKAYGEMELHSIHS